MSLLPGALMAVGGVASGLVWRWPSVGQREIGLFRRLNGWRATPAVDAVVRLLRPLGTTWGLMLIAAGLFVWDPAAAILLLAMAVFSGVVERGLKLGLRRKRPFEVLEGVVVRQVPPPVDPSFPSGDASRACYLGAALAFGLGWPLLASVAVLTLAMLVSLGRVRVGVHFPSDVWAGSWLGLGLGVMWAALLPPFRAWWS
ncbi:MAG: phosphatase PAP2 family protein [Chloroflexota bacterium]